jgi:hypothetical protein
VKQNETYYTTDEIRRYVAPGELISQPGSTEFGLAKRGKGAWIPKLKKFE